MYMPICFFCLLCKPSLKVFSNFFSLVNRGGKNVILIRDTVSSVAAAATRSLHKAADYIHGFSLVLHGVWVIFL